MCRAHGPRFSRPRLAGGRPPTRAAQPDCCRPCCVGSRRARCTTQRAAALAAPRRRARGPRAGANAAPGKTRAAKPVHAHGCDKLLTRRSASTLRPERGPGAGARAARPLPTNMSAVKSREERCATAQAPVSYLLSPRRAGQPQVSLEGKSM